MDNTRRVLEFLKNANQQCDWVSAGGYFSFTEAQHNLWNTQCSAVTEATVVAGADAAFVANEGAWTDQTAAFANQYGVGCAVYEGGQHMQPYLQGDWCYNQAVWDAQIHPTIYDLYMKNFRKMVEPAVNCRLVMAFSYIGERQSKFGSWGHLENLNQIGSTNMRVIAPKYQALLDANAAKTGARQAAQEAAQLSTDNSLVVYPNPANQDVNISGLTDNSVVDLVNMEGNTIVSHAFNTAGVKISVANIPSGSYILKIRDAKLGNKVVKLSVN